MVNVERLRKILEHVTAHPDEWKQARWAHRSTCGTSYCLAGTAITLFTDLKFVWTTDVNLHPSLSPTWSADAVIGSRGIEQSVERAAAHVLGLTNADARDLFNPLNELCGLWQAASVLTDGEIQVPIHLNEGDVA